MSLKSVSFDILPLVLGERTLSMGFVLSPDENGGCMSPERSLSYRNKNGRRKVASADLERRRESGKRSGNDMRNL